MKTKTFTPLDSLHPILFFAGMYLVALFFSIIICSSLFYSCNVNTSKIKSERIAPLEKPFSQESTVKL